MDCVLTAKIDSIAENYYNGFSYFLFMTRSVILYEKAVHHPTGSRNDRGGRCL